MVLRFRKIFLKLHCEYFLGRSMNETNVKKSIRCRGAVHPLPEHQEYQFKWHLRLKEEIYA